jgi:S1-C subfamily serine protease
MKRLLRSPFLAAVLGGLVVAGGFLALGVTGRRTTRTVVQQAPVFAQRASSKASSLTAHAIYERAAPAVVFIKARVTQPAQSPFALAPQRRNSSSTGSGFLVNRNGSVLTNYHLIEGADRNTGVTVVFEDAIIRQAAVIAEDQTNDLAVLKVDLTGVPAVAPLPVGDSTTIRVGDPTLSVGNPFGLDRTLTTGIVSALQREIQSSGGFTIDNVIQTDAPINPSISGGPLLDAAGRVIGINSQMAPGPGSGNAGVGIAFAVPINTAKALLPAWPRARTRAIQASR